MKAELFKMKCLTNMHVGSGDVNFNIIDKEVQRDPVTTMPTINSSGIKGALREFFKQKEEEWQTGTEEEKNFKEIFINIFGSEQNSAVSKPGKVKFLSGNMMAVPMRSSGGKRVYYMVTNHTALKNYIEMAKLSIPKAYQNVEEELVELDETLSYKCTEESVFVEGKEIINYIDKKSKIVKFLKTFFSISGQSIIIMNDSDFKSVSLPVMARNYLENGESKNLWYEEIVPHKTIFYFTVLANDGDKELLNDFKNKINNQVIQFGGNASIGYGFTKVERIDF